VSGRKLEIKYSPFKPPARPLTGRGSGDQRAGISDDQLRGALTELARLLARRAARDFTSQE
jgi:hypothetical protein